MWLIRYNDIFFEWVIIWDWKILIQCDIYMNLIKSLFIFIAPVILALIVTYAMMNIKYSSNIYLQIGLFLSASPLLLFLANILLFKNIARTNLHLPWVSVPSFMGYCLVLIVFMKSSNILYINDMVFALASFFITFLYIYWYSNNGRIKSGLLLNSQELPAFQLKDYSGNDILSKSFIGNKTLIFFFRGNWCPLCMAQIDEIVDLYKKFEENNINVIFISPQSAKNTKSLSDRYNLSFKFYIDKNNQAATQLGIMHKFGLPMGFQALGYESDSVYPTIIATNEKGKIIYNDQTSNYRVRPEPKELLSIFSIQ